MNRLLRIACYVWASPCTITGLLLVSPAFLFGARARVVDGVIEVANPLFEGSSDKKLWPFRAITFGHVVIGESARDLALLRGHRPYLDNWFEVEARRNAAKERFK